MLLVPIFMILLGGVMSIAVVSMLEHIPATKDVIQNAWVRVSVLIVSMALAFIIIRSVLWG